MARPKGVNLDPGPLVGPTPMAANWPARTWTPAERVTAGMMNSIRDQLNELHAGAVAAESNVNVIIRKNYPTLELWHTPGATSAARLRSRSDAHFELTANLQFDGTNWMRDNVGAGSFLLHASAGALTFYSAPAAANPATVTLLATISTAGLQCAIPVKSTVSGNNLADLTVGPTNFTQGVTLTGGNITGSGAFYISGVTYPGRVDNGAAQTSWYLGSHASYGLYSNTGLYLAGSLWVAGNVSITGNVGVGGLLQGIQAPRLVGLGAGAQGYQHDCATADMVTHYAINIGCSWYNPLNPRDGLAFIIAVRDQGGSVPLYWDGHFIAGGTQPLPTATPGASKTMYMVFRYNAYTDRWHMLAASTEP